MDAPLAPSNLFDDDGVIATDIACRRCAYNLRGLREDGRCPECGTPVGLSTSGDLLRFADPDWVEKLARGVRLMLWGLLITIVVSVIVGCIVGATGSPEMLTKVVSLLSGLLILYGAWLLTTPDPSRIGEDRYVTARRVIRFCLIAGLIGEAFEIAKDGISPAPWVLTILLTALAVILQLTGVVGEFAKFRYIENLADRIPNRKLASFARFMRWAFCIGLTAMILLGAALAFGFYRSGLTPTITGLPATTTSPAYAPNSGLNVQYSYSTGAPASQAAVTPTPGGVPVPSPANASAKPSKQLIGVTIATGCASLLAMVIFGILALVLYIQFAGELRRQAEAARLTWAAGQREPPPPPLTNGQ